MIENLNVYITIDFYDRPCIIYERRLFARRLFFIGQYRHRQYTLSAPDRAVCK